MSDSDGKKTLGLRGGPRAGNVKQSFSHGRSKSVVVETKRKRVVVPKPVTTFIKPSGKSASSKILINSKVEHDALSEGFITTVLPAARAGASFQINVPIGEFQGSTRATTPNGSHFK